MRSLQGSCKILVKMQSLVRSCKEICSLQDLARKFVSCKILQGNFFLPRFFRNVDNLHDFPKNTEPWKCKEQKTKILNCQSFKLFQTCINLVVKSYFQDIFLFQFSNFFAHSHFFYSQKMTQSFSRR